MTDGIGMAAQCIAMIFAQQITQVLFCHRLISIRLFGKIQRLNGQQGSQRGIFVYQRGRARSQAG